MKSMTVNFSRVGRGSIVGRMGRAALSLVPKRAVVPILQGELKGCKWIVGSSIHGCWLGSFEFEKQQLFKSHVKLGMTVYDIGANVGFYTLLSSRLAGADGAVYSFEPLPRNLGLLRRHVGLNTSGGGRCAGNVTVIDAAVSDAAGTAVFMPDVAPERAHMVGAGDQNANVETDKREASAKGISVRTVRVDDLATAERGAARSPVALRPPDLMKIDVEGAEEMVLRGASATIARYKPTIFLATHGPEVHAACLRLLRGWGYELTPIGGPDINATDEVIARVGR